MKLKKFCIEGFRGYKDRVCIELDDLTTIIGKNDAGKSTILEAMDGFFNGTKFDAGDYNIELTGTKEITLTAIFSDIPESIVIDETNPVALAEEYLLNTDGCFEIEKIYRGTSPAHKETFILANHPVNDNLNDLLPLNITSLRTRARELNIDLTGVNQRIKSEIRKKLWESVVIELEATKILIKDEDTKKIADKLEAYMPSFSLFKSDRPSTDQDAEAQDPMQIAIKEAMKKQEEALKVIADKVEEEVKAIANMTVDKLKTMDVDLANELNPIFKTDWGKVFKLSLTGDESIPINKRGSGVRRLILLNFFRVKAEQNNSGRHTLNTIYAVEEPETSQHPDNQKMLMNSFQELSENNDSQVIFTTHTPMLASYVNDKNIRYVNDKVIINEISDENKKEIARNLGVLPDHKVKVFLGVEGVNDINYLKSISRLISSHNQDAINLDESEDNGKVVMIPFGGSSFKLWINRLNSLNVNEFHICDRDYAPPSSAHYQSIVDEINMQENKQAYITQKRELENYIHHQSIMDIYREQHDTFTLSEFSDFDDVPLLVAKHLHELSESDNLWDEVNPEKQKQKISKVKKRLNDEAVKVMSYEQYCEVDNDKEIEQWLVDIKEVLNED